MLHQRSDVGAPSGSGAVPLSRLLGDLAAGISWSDVGASSAAAARLRTLDALGIVVGAVDRPAFSAALRYLELSGRVAGGVDAGAASPLLNLFPERGPVVAPATHGYLLGAAAFIDNHGDTSLHSVLHPNTVIIPAVLAAARTSRAPGDVVLAAIVAGYQISEVLGRTLNAGQPRMAHQVRGFRPTATCGPAGVAAAVGRVWGLDARTIGQSIALACNLAAGLRRTDASSTAHMRLHSGEAVERGINAVNLARAGVGVDEHFLEGEGGFFAAMAAGELGSPPVQPGSPDDWYVSQVAVKLHATPHTLAAALDCLAQVAREDPTVVDRIESVSVYLPAAHAAISLGAATADVTSLSAAEALDHLPFCASAVLHTGEVVLPELARRCLERSDVLRLAQRVTVHSDPVLSSVFEHDPGSWPVRVELLVDGELRVLERHRPRGVEDTPAVRDDLQRKFLALTAGRLFASQADALTHLVASLESSDDVYADLRQIVVGGPPDRA